MEKNDFEKNEIVRFSVTSDGTNGEKWIDRLESEGFIIRSAEPVLLSPDFKPTMGVEYEIVLIKNTFLKKTKEILAYAAKNNFSMINAETVCLIREKISNKELQEMGLDQIIGILKNISDPIGNPVLLASRRYGKEPWLHTYNYHPDYEPMLSTGFAFLVSQISYS